MDYTTFKNNLNKISGTRGISVKSNMDRGIEEYKKKYRRVGKYLDEILEGF